MPVIGFGTYLITDEEAPRTVNSAIKKLGIGTLIPLKFTEMKGELD